MTLWFRRILVQLGLTFVGIACFSGVAGEYWNAATRDQGSHEAAIEGSMYGGGSIEGCGHEDDNYEDDLRKSMACVAGLGQRRF